MKARWWLLALVAVALISGAVGVWGALKFHKPEPQVIEKVTVREVPKETIRYVTRTQVQYVPKEVDKVTGKVESTDVEARLMPPKVTVKLNDKIHEFDLLNGETQKFQDGKLVLEQASDLNINIKAPEPSPKRYQLALGYGTNGIAVGVQGRLGKNSDVGWWIHGDGEAVSAGLSIRF